MAEHAYLSAVTDVKRLDEARVLLSAKRNFPVAWFFPFARENVGTLGKRLALAARSADAAALAQRRIEALAPKCGPKLVAVLRGFAQMLASLREPWLVLDAGEMAGLLGEQARAALEEQLDTMDAVDAGELRGLDLGEAVEEKRARYELDASTAEDVYDFIGGSVDREWPWLRPPSSRDAKRLRAIDEAFAAGGYTQLSGPEAREAGIEVLFTHPRHGRAVFAVTLLDDDAYAFASRASAGAADDVRFGPIRTSRALGAWAAHVAAHFDLVSTSPKGRATPWYWQEGARAFAERMATHEEDLEAFRAELPRRLVREIEQFVIDETRGPITAIDLGPLGQLRLDRMSPDDWEPHVLATLHRTAGDARWRAPTPELLVSPLVQDAAADAYVRELATQAAATGVSLEWSDATKAPSGRGAIVLHADRVEPARFTAGFLAARPRERDVEAEAKVVFAGENLLIVTANGARVSFRFPVPRDLVRSAPVFVSGWWTARSGDRFASILRIGDRVFRFDNDGRLLAP